MKNKQTYEIVLTGLGMAIVFVTTLYIQVPNAVDGYFNLGDGFILLFASFLNPFAAFLVGGLGSALADIAGGYAYYFVFTLIIKGIEGAIVAYALKTFSKKKQISAYILAGIWMIFGYWIAKWILKGSMIVACMEIIPNTIQATAGIMISLVAYPIVKKALSSRFALMQS